MSTQKTVAKAAVLMMAAIFLSRILGLVREVIIAHEFGQGSLVSAYVAAFNLPDLLYFFLSSGALSSAFIPVFVQYMTEGKERDAWRIFSAIACLMALTLGGVVVLSEIFTRPLVIALAAPGYRDDPVQLGRVVALTRIILPSQLFFFAGGLIMATLEARQRFTARALAPVIYNIGIIIGALVLARWFDIAGLAWGALIGAFAGNIVLSFISLRRAGYQFLPNLNLRHPGVVKVGKLAVPVMLGLSLPQIDVIINRWFATLLAGDEAVAALNYGNRLMQVPLGVFAQAGAIAFFPTLAACAARGEMAELKSNLNFAIRGILFLTIPASVFMMVLSEPIIRAIYQHGQYAASSAPLAASALFFYSVGIFAWGGQAVIARGFYALQDTLTVVLVGTVMTIIFIPMNWTLMQVMGLGGLALATSIAAALHMFALMFLLRRRLDGLGAKQLAISVGKVLLASGGLAGACWAAQYIVGHGARVTTQMGAINVIAIALPSSIVVYLALMWLMRSEELEFFGAMVKEQTAPQAGIY